jgi:hypothetical protein
MKNFETETRPNPENSENGKVLQRFNGKIIYITYFVLNYF